MKNTKLPEKEYLTVAEVKEWLNLNQGAVYALTHRKDFPVAHFGGAIRIPREAFLGWVAVNTSNPMGYGNDVA